MPYTPTESEARRLEQAIELAKFGEAERVLWLTALTMIAAVGATVLVFQGPWQIALATFFATFVLYWRLRGCHLATRYTGHRGLFGINLITREQRAFTALMLRQALTGRNALAASSEHDPFAEWQRRVGPREAAPDESG